MGKIIYFISDYNIQMGDTGVRECDGQFSGN